MASPHRTQHTGPTTGHDTDRILEATIETLGKVRGLPWLGDAGATVHLIASLIAAAEQRLPRAVADSRDQDYSWTEIADLLGVTRASAWQHYAHHTTRNRTPLNPDCQWGQNKRARWGQSRLTFPTPGRVSDSARNGLAPIVQDPTLGCQHLATAPGDPPGDARSTDDGSLRWRE